MLPKVQAVFVRQCHFLQFTLADLGSVDSYMLYKLQFCVSSHRGDFFSRAQGWDGEPSHFPYFRVGSVMMLSEMKRFFFFFLFLLLLEVCSVLYLILILRVKIWKTWSIPTSYFWISISKLVVLV